MTTPTTSLSFSSIQTEFGGSNPISLSEYYRGGSNVPSGLLTSATDGSQVSTGGAIRAGTFRGVTKIINFIFNLTLSSGYVNFNLKNNAIAAGWNQTDPLIATITIANSGIYVYSMNTSLPAFTTGSGFPAGSVLTLVNHGNIIGAGGPGGGGASFSGATAIPATAGGTGGPAVNASYPLAIYNYGILAGGGGGGGGGGSSRGSSGKSDFGVAGGGGGGGGCASATGGVGGYPIGQAQTASGNVGGTATVTAPGAGGVRGVISGVSGGGNGGSGGGIGFAGAPGSNADYSQASFYAGGYTPGAAGGSVGNYLTGASNVTWPGATGSRYGGTT